MTFRINESTVKSGHPFELISLDLQQPAGACHLALDDETTLKLSLFAYQQTAMILPTLAISVLGGSRQVFPINSSALETSLGADARA